MIRTWHGSCYAACTCTTSPYQSQRIAREVPSPRLSIGRPAQSSRPGRAATLNNPEHSSSLPVGRRSLMGGCAIWRQTWAQGCALALHVYRAIRPTHHFIQRQTSRHGSAGAAAGYCRVEALAVGKTGRRSMGGLGCLLPYYHLAGRFGVRSSFRAIDGIEAGTSHLVANLIQHRRQRGFQAFAERLPSHSSASVRYAPTGIELGDRKIGNSSQAGQH